MSLQTDMQNHEVKVNNRLVTLRLREAASNSCLKARKAGFANRNQTVVH